MIKAVAVVAAALCVTVAATAATASFVAIQESENDAARHVFLHRPGQEAFFGSLHPAGALFMAPFSSDAATEQFRRYEAALAEHGVQVHLVEDLLAQLDLAELRGMAMDALTYRLVDEEVSDTDGVREPEQSAAEDEEEEEDDIDLTVKSDGDGSGGGGDGDVDYLSKRYKWNVVRMMNRKRLVRTVLLRPMVLLKRDDRNTGIVTVGTKLQPLTNLVFTRDPQIVTTAGLVVTNLHSSQRAMENEVMYKLWRHLAYQPDNDVRLLGRIEDPGKLEGGDYMPVSKDLAMLGVGLRTNMEAAEQLLRNDWFGTTRVALVVETEHDQERMHLDTVFNIAAPKVGVILDSIINKEERHRRVIEFRRAAENEVPEYGPYVRVTPKGEQGMELSRFLQEREGFQLAQVTDEQQMQYIINFINVGNNAVIAVNSDLEDVLRPIAPHLRVTTVAFDQVTSMYGAAHCVSQLFREPNTSVVGPDAEHQARIDEYKHRGGAAASAAAKRQEL